MMMMMMTVIMKRDRTMPSNRPLHRATKVVMLTGQSLLIQPDPGRTSYPQLP